MGDIIIFDTEYNATKEKRVEIKRTKMTLSELVSQIKEEEKKYLTYEDAEEMAHRVIAASDCEHVEGAIPIIQIANQLDFRTMAVSGMPEDMEGNLYIGGRTIEFYDTNKVIVVSEKENDFKQRFILAHELGHYFIDYLSTDRFRHPNELFAVAYKKHQKEHDAHEKIIDRFAAELLMPRERFINQYLIAAEFSNNNKVYINTYLSKVFKTEPESIEIRMKEVGLVTQ